MSSRIILKKSSVVDKAPLPSDLEYGELAINYSDGRLYFKNSSNSIKSFYYDPGLLDLKDVVESSSSEDGWILKTDGNGNYSFVDPAQNIDLSLSSTDDLPEGNTNLYSKNLQKIYYVSGANGDDTNSGQEISHAFATVDKALSVVQPGDSVQIANGSYTINNPLTIPENVSLIGDNLRTVSIAPANPSSDIFYINNRCYVAEITFRDHVNGAAAFAFNPDGSAGTITVSPYIQNCSSITTTGIGMRIDGNHAGGTRSMVSDSFTQINAGGIGVQLLNRGYAQLVSIFTVFCDIGIHAKDGGFCSLTNSNCSFGNYGLKSEGVSELIHTESVNGNYSEEADTIQISATEPPRYSEAFKIGSTDYYYTVDTITDLGGGIYEIGLLGNLQEDITDGTSVEFYQRSLITASSITFEYVGSGIDRSTALPENGGFPVQGNEVVQDEDSNAGQVFFTSTDQKGDFRIGGELLINRESGFIEGQTFDRSLFAKLTPFILALED